MSLISVIIPAYNAEKHIAKCLDSILTSTYKNLEVIVVNDGSTDNTKQVVESFLSDGRLILHNKENGGVSIARNIGLDMASGDYISFIDADDYIDEYFFERLVNQFAINPLVDVSCCRIVQVDENGVKIGKGFTAFENDFILKPNEIANDYFHCLDMGIVNFACCKIFKKKVIENIRFSTTLKWGEDGSFNLDVFKNMNFMSIIKEEMYFYVMHSSQTTAKKMKNYSDMMIQHFNDIYIYIDKYSGFENELVKVGMGKCWLGVFMESVRHSNSYKEYKMNFINLKKAKWIELAYNCQCDTLKLKLAKKLVLTNNSLFMYLLVKLYHGLIKIKRSFS